MYYLVTVTTFKDGSQDAISAFEYETKDQAKMVFHQTMASAMANTNVKSAMCQILNEHGGAEIADLNMRFYQAPVEPEPEPEPEPEA